ncbi:MAG: KaiA-binding protein [Euryarchaeota archaeon]|nr:KaiA-binding protein [Euryarchaeota archaeon]
MYALNRVPSGIVGLDDMTEGGFPFPSVMLLAGSAGTGKTTFAQKFLFAGADSGERCLYLTTLSEPTQWMLRFASQFEFVDKRHFGTTIKYCDMGQMIRDGDAEKILNFIDERVAETMAQRVVIDPITVVGDFLKSSYRVFLFDLVNRLKNWQAVTLLTGEVKPGELYPPEVAYAADGVIVLYMSEEDGARRKYIEVVKLRGTNHVTGKFSYDITRKEGIMILKSKF